MLPRDLRVAVVAQLPLTVLQRINEAERSATANRAPEESYFCSASTCRQLLAFQYGLTEAEIVRAYDAVLAEGLLLPADVLTKIASLFGVPAYDQHLYLSSDHGFLFAARAQRLDLLQYYIDRYSQWDDVQVYHSALRYYLNRIPNVAQIFRNFFMSEAAKGLLGSTSLSDTAANEKIFAPSEYGFHAILNELHGNNTQGHFVKPFWPHIITTELIAMLPNWLARVDATPPSDLRSLYQSAFLILLGGVPDVTMVTGLMTSYGDDLYALALSVMNRPAYEMLEKLQARLMRSGKWLAVSEVLYQPTAWRDNSTIAAQNIELVRIWSTSLFLGGHGAIVMENRGGYAYRSPIENVLSVISDPNNHSEKTLAIDSGVAVVVGRPSGGNFNRGRYVVVVTPEDAARIVPLLPLLRIVCWPLTPALMDTMLRLFPALASRVPGKWKKHVRFA